MSKYSSLSKKPYSGLAGSDWDAFDQLPDWLDGPGTDGTPAAPPNFAASQHAPAAAAPGMGTADAAPPATGGEITLIDAVSFAKGGGPGGGGSPGGGGGTVGQYFAGSADGSAGYDIWIEFKGTGWTAEFQKAFTQMADYLTQVVTADIGGGGLYRGKAIDDLYVTAELKSIDGVGGVLGQAGPMATWTATDLTAAGQMQFDIADAQTCLGKGLWDDIVAHEFMHVLGFGSLWNYGSHSLASGSQYTGALALAAYQETHAGETFIPVETDGGSGTAGSHWDEAALGNELMTGYINDDGKPATTDDNHLSEFSIMSLGDLGYQVAYKDYPYDNVATG